MITSIFAFWSSSEILSWSKSIVYSLFFPQGFWGDGILKDNLQKIKWTWIDQGGVLQNICIIYDQLLTVIPRDTPFGRHCIYLYINKDLCNKDNSLCHFLSFHWALQLAVCTATVQWPKTTRRFRFQIVQKLQLWDTISIYYDVEMTG